jgi:hypothetical protein
MHDDIPRCYDWNPILVRHEFDGTAVNVVHRALMQCEPDPCTRRENVIQPLALSHEHVFFRREIGYEDGKAVGHAAQMRKVLLWLGNVLRS